MANTQRTIMHGLEVRADDDGLWGWINVGEHGDIELDYPLTDKDMEVYPQALHGAIRAAFEQAQQENADKREERYEERQRVSETGGIEYQMLWAEFYATRGIRS